MLSSEDLYVNCVNSDSSQAFIIIFFLKDCICISERAREKTTQEGNEEMRIS